MSRTRKEGKHELSRREFIEAGSAAAAAGLLLPACSDGSGLADGGADGGLDGDTWDGDGDLTHTPDCASDELPEDAYADCRVVRVHDRRVSSYTFAEEAACWEAIDGEVIREMLDAAIVEIARAATIGEAWQALLPGDLATAVISVKVNLNGDQQHFVNNSPAMMSALVSSLVEAGAAAENITLFDASRRFQGVYRDPILAAHPNVQLYGGGDVALHPSEIVAAPSMVRADGSHISCPTPVSLVEADHFINLHLMKGHNGGGTGAMKNLFGLARSVWDTFHGREDWGLSKYQVGRQCADLATHPLVREKSRVLIAEGVHSTWWHANKPPDRFRNEDLFPGGMPCSVTVGRNPLYQDTVIYDFIEAERDYAPLNEGRDVYPDDWLRYCSEEPYNIGEFAHGRLVDGTFTNQDMAYSHIDYRSFSTEV